MSEQPERIYIIGAGNIAQHHAAGAEKLPGNMAILVADTNPRALEGFKERFPEANAFDSVHEMLNEPPEPGDITVVATPTFTHSSLACAALESGRHVICEKPLGMDRSEALKMLDLARSKERYLGCCSTRFLGLVATEEAKRLLRESALGEIYHVTFVNRQQRSRTGIEYQGQTTWFLDHSKNGGGTLMDWSPYDFTVLNDLLEPERVDVLGAWMANPETALDLPKGTVFDTEQHAGALLRYHLHGGKTVHVTYERAACTHGGERSVVEVEGSQGAVSWDWLGPGSLIFSQDKGGKVRTERKTFATESLPQIHQRPIRYFHKLVSGEKSHAVVNERAVFNFLCIRSIYDCATTGKPQSVSLGEDL